jgi:hypothetical protein
MTDSIIKTTDIIDTECRETFLKKDFFANDSESLCVRVIRKKFKCFMLLLLILLLMLQIINTILSNINEEDFNKYLKQLLHTKNISNTDSYVSREYD